MTDIEATFWQRVLAVVITACMVTLAAVAFDSRPDPDEEEDTDE